MTTVVILADPPWPEVAVPGLTARGAYTPTAAADLYGAMLRDVARAAAAAGGDLLVNYRPDDLLPEDTAEENAEAAVRTAVTDALADPSVARYEPQVGSTPSARLGNTVTHLLCEEDATSVGVVRPTAPLLTRTLVDAAAMKSRSAPVVLGPAPTGRIHYAAFTESIDFTDALEPPAVRTIAERARDAGHVVDFVEMAPVLERPRDLSTVRATVDARRLADRPVPTHTAAALDDHGITFDDQATPRTDTS